MKVIITGSGGVLGKSLVKFFEEKGADVYKRYFDITNKVSTTNLIKYFKPDYFINTAGISYVLDNEMVKSLSVNTLPVAYQLSAIEKYVPNCKYLNCGSVHEFSGNTPYAVSKINAHKIVDYYKSKKIYAIQPFLSNFTSLDQDERLILPKVINAFKRKEFPLEVGNIYSKKSFLWVDDVVEAIWISLNIVPGPLDCIVKPEDMYYIFDVIVRIADYTNEYSALWEENEKLIDEISREVLVKSNPSNFRIESEAPPLNSYPKINDFGWSPKKNLDKIIKILYDNTL